MRGVKYAKVLFLLTTYKNDCSAMQLKWQGSKVKEECTQLLVVGAEVCAGDSTFVPLQVSLQVRVFLQRVARFSC